MATKTFHVAADWKFIFTAADSVDLTGAPAWALECNIRLRGSDSPQITKVSGVDPGTTAINESTRKNEVFIPNEDTVLLEKGSYYVDLWRTDDGSTAPLYGPTLILVKGTAKVRGTGEDTEELN